MNVIKEIKELQQKIIGCQAILTQNKRMIDSCPEESVIDLMSLKAHGEKISEELKGIENKLSELMKNEKSPIIKETITTTEGMFEELKNLEYSIRNLDSHIDFYKTNKKYIKSISEGNSFELMALNNEIEDLVKIREYLKDELEDLEKKINSCCKEELKYLLKNITDKQLKRLNKNLKIYNISYNTYYNNLNIIYYIRNKYRNPKYSSIRLKYILRPEHVFIYDRFDDKFSILKVFMLFNKFIIFENEIEPEALCNIKELEIKHNYDTYKNIPDEITEHNIIYHKFYKDIVENMCLEDREILFPQYKIKGK